MLATGGPPVPETGEHTVAITSTCAFASTPHVEVLGLHGRRLGFTYLAEGGPIGQRSLMLDKYRCDVRYRDLGHTLAIGRARLDLGRSLLDWCPAEAVSTVVHVYLGGVRRRPATRAGVFRDISDGRFDRAWPCAALRDALAHLPVDGPAYSTVGLKLGRAAEAACDAQVAGIARGAPRFAVAAAFGEPSFGGPRCPVWRWKPFDSSVDGVRVCFSHARATLVQTALHG